MSTAALFHVKDNFQLSEENADLRLSLGDSESKSKLADKAADKLHIIDLAEQLAEYQNILYAQKKHKVLVILQGMDTSGKDGTVRAVFGQINPSGSRSISFKAPTSDELAHDFLWRIHAHVPALGEIVVFNRSHYEDVLISKVHAWINAEECQRRYAHINDFERMLSETGTLILKFFLHISKDEQKKRLEERLADPDKHWKINEQDLAERQFWNDYQSTYQNAINATNTKHAPWYVIPANSKTQRNLAIAEIVGEKMRELKLSYPSGKPNLSALKLE